MITGTNGAVVSGASTGALGPRLPALSVAETPSISPLVCGGVIDTVNVPSPPAVPLPNSTLLALVTLTVLPGSALPVTTVPSSFTCKFVGASGAVWSCATTVALGLVL